MDEINVSHGLILLWYRKTKKNYKLKINHNKPNILDYFANL